TSWAVNGRGAAQESADDTLSGVFGFREPTALALSGHSDAQKCPDDIFAKHTVVGKMELRRHPMDERLTRRLDDVQLLMGMASIG
ncbi:MAG: hypothetical protein GY838_09925, partial [bacterium]|nr:hypothetical protein [bacterium]